MKGDLLQEYNDKYSHFRNGGLPNYDMLCSIFCKSSATGEYGHASTITPPELVEGDCGFDLNSPPTSIDLLDADNTLTPNIPSRSKGKRKISYSGSRANKRSSIEDKDVEGFKAGLSDMMDSLDSVKESVSRRSCGTSQKYDPVEAVMVRINALRTHPGVPLEKYFKAADYVTDPNHAKVVNSMADETLKAWLLPYI